MSVEAIIPDFDPGPPTEEIPACDWSILEDERIGPIVNMVADAVGAKCGAVTSSDDVHQEASIWCALNAEDVREMLAKPLVGERHLYRRLHDRMLDLVKTEQARANRNVGLAELSDDPDRS